MGGRTGKQGKGHGACVGCREASRGQRRLSAKVRFEQRPEGREDVGHAVSRERSSGCKGPEVRSQDVEVAGGAEVSG